MNRKSSLFFLAALVLLGASCQKWQDKPGEDLGLTNKYCNNPAAINYNHGFPGIEDSTVCVFPTEPFVGVYNFDDSIYSEINELQEVQSYTFSIQAKSRFQFELSDLCGPDRKFSFSADRYYRAASDSILGNGLQLFCRDLDTLSGSMIYRPEDSSLYIQWTIKSDTANNIHSGTAYKQ